MNNPLISIIIPVYNTEQYLENCLNSLINQTFKDIEIICINDGSTDNSLQILETFKKKDVRIVILNQQNSGPAMARNKGLSHALGKYIMFCDSDDEYAVDMCEKMYSQIHEKDYDLVMCNCHVIISDNTDRANNKTYINDFKLKFIGERILDAEIRKNIGTMLWNKIFKKSIIDKYSIRFPYYDKNEDNAFIYQYLSCINKIYGLEEKLYYYTIRANSLIETFSFSTSEKGIGSFYNLIFVFENLKKHNLLKQNLGWLIGLIHNKTFVWWHSLKDKKAKNKALHLLNKLLINVPEQTLEKTNYQLLKYIKQKKYKKAYSVLEKKEYYSFLEKLFSVKNSYNNKHKIITISGIKFKIRSHKQLIKSDSKNNLSPIKFRTFQNLTDLIRNNIAILPSDIDLVVGIPRSGIIPAYIIALFLNKNVCSLNEFINNLTPLKGNRTINTANNHGRKKILVVDDSINSGNSLKKVKEQLNTINISNYDIEYCCVFATHSSKFLVNYYFEIVEQPRIFQWNYLNHIFAQNCCFDMDGVLCVDPTKEQNDDGPQYINFLLNAKPLYIPTYPINSIVTSRLEKYRPQTEEWLKKYNVKYKNLYMLDLSTAEERRKLNCHADFKAKVFSKCKDCNCFIESNREQAEKIFKLTNKTCICIETDEMFCS